MNAFNLKNLISSAIAIIVFCSAAVAQSSVKDGKAVTDWTLLASGPGEWVDQKNETHELDAPVKTYFAMGTIARGGDIVKVWVKWDYPNSMGTLIQDLGLPQDFSSLRVYVVLDCKRSEMSAVTMLLYDLKGKLALSGTTDAAPKEIPNTMGSELMKYFCELPSTATQLPTLKAKQ